MERYEIELQAPGFDRPGTVIRYGHYGRPDRGVPQRARARLELREQRHGRCRGRPHRGRPGSSSTASTPSTGESWSNTSIPLEERAQRHRAFRVLGLRAGPAGWIGEDSPGVERRIGHRMHSLGAYHALNFALTRADLFPVAICQSGNYDPTGWTPWGERSNTAYFTNPTEYVAPPARRPPRLAATAGSTSCSPWGRVRGRRTRPARCRPPTRWASCWPTRGSRTSSTCGGTTPPTTGTWWPQADRPPPAPLRLTGVTRTPARHRLAPAVVVGGHVLVLALLEADRDSP